MERRRLKSLLEVNTDKASYVIYNTQTVEEDAVNIEIERTCNGKAKVILEKEIFSDSWGAMNGQSFSSLVSDAKNHLSNYIINKKETAL